MSAKRTAATTRVKNLTQTKTVASGKYEFSLACAHLLYAMLATGDCGGRLQAGMPYRDVILHFTRIWDLKRDGKHEQ